MNQAKGERGMDAHTWEDAIGEGPQHHLKKDQNRCENSAGTTMQSTCTQQQLQTNKSLMGTKFQSDSPMEGEEIWAWEVPWKP